MILHLLLKWCSIIDTLGSSLVLCSEYIKREVLILVALTTIYSFLKTPNPNFITPLTLLNPLFTNNKLQLPFSFLVHVSWFFLCIFFLHIKGMPIPFKFHQVLFISRLFFLAQLPLKTLALSRIAHLCQMNSYQQIIHLCQITNSLLFFYLFFFFYLRKQTQD